MHTADKSNIGSRESSPASNVSCRAAQCLPDLLGADTPLTIVKRGSKSVELYQNGDAIESFDVEAVSVIDPTGAGDAFSGTILAKLAAGDSVHHAINAAMTNSALAVRTIGARPEQTRNELEHFFTHYKDLEPGKWVKVGSWAGKDAAQKLIDEALERFKAQGGHQ